MPQIRRTPTPTALTSYSMPYKFGIEIECFGSSREDLQQAIDCTTGLRGWSVKHDGSVTGNGIEVISPPLNATTRSFNQVKKICKILENKRMSVDRSCGLHVHLSRIGGWSVGQIATIYRRYAFFESEIDLHHSESRRRNTNRYCQAIVNKRLSRNELARFWNINTLTTYQYLPNYSEEIRRREATRTLMRETNYERYYKVNLQSLGEHGTIEFRQHAGTIDKDKIINWTKFLIEFCQKSINRLETPSSLASTSVEQLTQNNGNRQTFPTRNVAARLLNNRNNQYHLSPTKRLVLKAIYDAGSDGISMNGIKNSIRTQARLSLTNGTILNYVSVLRSELRRMSNYSYSTDCEITRTSNNRFVMSFQTTRQRNIALAGSVNWINFEGDNLFDGVSSQVVSFMNQRKAALSNHFDPESVEPSAPTRRQTRRANQALTHHLA